MRQPPRDGRVHEIGRQEGKRDRHVDLANAAPLALGDAFRMCGRVGKKFVKPAAPSRNRCDQVLCGATQHSNTDPFDRTSPGIPIGPHWMIIWPNDAKRCGLPNTVRDAGAWVMFDGTPYAYLHICGTPWTGNEYGPGQIPIWTMRYGKPLER
jgi:hypothetical protein